MTKEKMQGFLFTMIGMLFVGLTIYIRRSGVDVPDFGMGLMNGAGIGFLLLALLRYRVKPKGAKNAS
jgi:hypothetical protein